MKVLVGVEEPLLAAHLQGLLLLLVMVMIQGREEQVGG